MNASFVRDETLGENLQAELTDAAFRVAARHGVKGPSVDQEVDLWKALGRVVGNQHQTFESRVVPVDDRRGRETLVAEATDAAYRVALDHGFQGSFLELELDLWENMCLTVHRNRGMRRLPC
jgi:hypothetical protein